MLLLFRNFHQTCEPDSKKYKITPFDVFIKKSNPYFWESKEIYTDFRN